MNRYRNYGALDDTPEPFGDVLFRALDMGADPATLGSGVAQVSENFRFTGNGPRPREGISRQLAVGDTVPTIRFAGIYRPNGGHDRLAFVTQSALVLFDPATQDLTTVNYPGGETVASTDAVDFIQAGISSGTTPDAYILRGTGKTALKYDGTNVTVAAAFQRGNFGLFTQDRIAVADSNQSFQVSDFLDFTTWSLLNQFKLLWGGDDTLVGLLSYQKDYVVIGTRKRFFIAYFAPQFGTGGYDGGLNDTTSFLRDLTREAGPVGRRAMGEAAGLIWFVSDNGIYAFTPNLNLELTVLGKPLSAPIAPIMQRLSANYAGCATFQHFGNRLYFALPISSPLTPLLAITVAGGTATATLTSGANDLLRGAAVGDLLQIKGAMDADLNGTQTLTGVNLNAALDTGTFTFATAAAPGASVGARCLGQLIAQRPNTIAVFNLASAYQDPAGQQYPGAWESIDVLPAGIYADYLVIADDGAGRRLWLIDRDQGPCLYEQGEVDEVGSQVGGLTLDFDLDADLNTGNYESTYIAGRFKSRVFRWGGFPRKVVAGEVRLSCAAGDQGHIIYSVRTPDRPAWSETRSFNDSQADTSARKRCGRRGLEADIEVRTTGGRPAIRAMAIQTVEAGRVAEE